MNDDNKGPINWICDKTLTYSLETKFSHLKTIVNMWKLLSLNKNGDTLDGK